LCVLLDRRLSGRRQHLPIPEFIVQVEDRGLLAATLRAYDDNRCRCHHDGARVVVIAASRRHNATRQNKHA
jgi:hypothetical protein